MRGRESLGMGTTVAKAPRGWHIAQIKKQTSWNYGETGVAAQANILKQQSNFAVTSYWPSLRRVSNRGNEARKASTTRLSRLPLRREPCSAPSGTCKEGFRRFIWK